MRPQMLLFGFVFIVSICSLPYRLKSHRKIHEKTHEIEPQWFTQKLDHFDPQNDAFWKQKFLVNSDYWGGDGYPIFMVLGGEGPIRTDYVTTHFILSEYARTFKALIVSVEHRFYGDSMPTPDLSTNNLKYLSSEQALADYAALALSLLKMYKAPRSKIISFGGSYSGSLSAWFRMKYPHIVHAALASSAPVKAQINFPEYFEVVATSLSQIPNCDTTILEATDYYMRLSKTSGGRAKIVKDFSTCSNLDTNLDVVTFFEYLADSISGFVQYNNDNNDYYPFNINKMCSILMSGPIDQAFPAFIAQWNKFSGSNCSDSSYSQDLQTLMNVDPKSPYASGRSWYYQTCTEFGYYQTGFEGSIFSPNISLDYFVGMCKSAFNINLGQIQSRVDWTNTNYGARDIISSRIMFTNGKVDPWHTLGITKESYSQMPVMLIDGTAHCADLYPSKSDDLPQLTAARIIFQNYLSGWLKEN